MTVETYEPAPLARIDSWAMMLADVAKLAEIIAPTELVPEYLRGNPAGVTAIILFGREIGLPPMTSLGTLYLTGGKVHMYAEPMAALVFAAGHEIRYDEDTSARCIVAGRRKGSTVWHSVTWTLEQARSIGLVQRNATWRNYPRRMLKARAVSELCRDLFPDVLAGIVSVEEAEDESQEASNGKATRVRRRTSGAVSDAKPPQEIAPAAEESADPAAVSAPEPESAAVPPSTEAPPPPAPRSEPVEGGTRSRGIADVELPGDDEPETAPRDPADRPYTPEQRALMHRLFGQLEITDRQRRIDVTGALIGRPVKSANELTIRDASRLIDTLGAVVSTENPQEVLDGILRTEGYVVNDPMPFADEPEP